MEEALTVLMPSSTMCAWRVHVCRLCVWSVESGEKRRCHYLCVYVRVDVEGSDMKQQPRDEWFDMMNIFRIASRQSQRQRDQTNNLERDEIE
jgi:hypothetical protein